jgi:hypothetical protein
MQPVDEIKRLYHSATRTTIQRDLTRAIALLKTIETEEERERVAVYMDGLSQMRSEWGVNPQGAAPAGGPRKPAHGGRTPGRAPRTPAR